MYDRALQALIKLALEPEWEGKFEANSYGFRPGRSCHDAIEAIFTSIKQKTKYVLDAAAPSQMLRSTESTRKNCWKN